jgi:hypothetical protein
MPATIPGLGMTCFASLFKVRPNSVALMSAVGASGTAQMRISRHAVKADIVDVDQSG